MNTKVKKTTKAKADAKAKRAAKPRKKSRAAKIMTVLESSKAPKTVREICQAIHVPKGDAKFVSSILISFEASKKVSVKEKTCPISGREVNAYQLRKSA